MNNVLRLQTFDDPSIDGGGGEAGEWSFVSICCVCTFISVGC